ncbi:hypothetical protein HDE_12166 [Halotydeus destructor]|nr:hypothetical protein HDE_12166 [Halotydeus destructor]
MDAILLLFTLIATSSSLYTSDYSSNQAPSPSPAKTFIYLGNDTQLGLIKAKSQCSTRAAIISEPRTMADMQICQNISYSNQFWVDAYFEPTSQTFKWASDNSNVTNIDWSTGEPSCLPTCGWYGLTVDGSTLKWSSVVSNTNVSVVCELKASQDDDFSLI